MSGVDTFAGITGFPIQPDPFAGETLQLDLACLPGDHLSLTRAPGSIKSDSASRELLQILTETGIEGLIALGRHERTGDRVNLSYEQRSWLALC